MSATATARATSTSTTPQASTCARSAARARPQGQLDCPHGLIVDTRAATPVLLVADRSNRRLQRFSLDGTHSGFDEGFPHPCHFSEHKGVMVVPDLFAKVTLVDRQNAVVAELGDNGPDSWKELAHRAARGVPDRQVRVPARRDLRSRGQHLRGRMGRDRPGDEAAEGVKAEGWTSRGSASLPPSAFRACARWRQTSRSRPRRRRRSGSPWRTPISP